MVVSVLDTPASPRRPVALREPIFVLGHYRSGTTLLHHLFAADDRFATVNSYQATFPHTFLRNEAMLARMGAALAIRRRPQDNLEFDPRHPAEDELALCTDTQLSPHLAWHFPRRADFYNRRYLTFDDASSDERQRWIASLRRLAAKLTLKHRRRLLFKSPLHTARVPLLLEAFPDARFVHVHRDPYRVYQSTHHMELAVEPFFRYQCSHPESLDERILRRYRVMYEAYLRDRVSIPDGRLAEVRFDALEAAPMETLESIYRDLRLPEIDAARPALKRHLESVRAHRKNAYGQLAPEAAARVRQQWKSAFEAFGYPA